MAEADDVVAELRALLAEAEEVAAGAREAAGEPVPTAQSSTGSVEEFTAAFGGPVPKGTEGLADTMISGQMSESEFWRAANAGGFTGR